MFIRRCFKRDVIVHFYSYQNINEGTTIQLWKIVTYRPWHCQRYYASITVMNRARRSWYINNHVYFRIIFLVFNWFEILFIHVKWKHNLNSTKWDVLAWRKVLSGSSFLLTCSSNILVYLISISKINVFEILELFICSRLILFFFLVGN